MLPTLAEKPLLLPIRLCRMQSENLKVARKPRVTVVERFGPRLIDSKENVDFGAKEKP